MTATAWGIHATNAHAQANATQGPPVLRIGYQKSAANLVVIKQQGWLLESPQACPLPLRVASDLIPYPLAPRELIELDYFRLIDQKVIRDLVQAVTARGGG